MSKASDSPPLADEDREDAGDEGTRNGGCLDLTEAADHRNVYWRREREHHLSPSECTCVQRRH